MSWRRLFVSLAACAICGASSAARGELLFSRALLIDRSANIFTTSQFGLKIDFSNSFTTPTTNTAFGNVVISPLSVGNIYDLEPGDAGFSAIAAQLNDAVNQAMRFVMTESASGRAEGRGYTQSQLFSKLPPLAPDFVGKVIDKIELKIDQFTLVFPLPGGAQAVTSGKPVQLNFTFNVFGHAVPEPSTLALAGGVLLLATAKKRRAG